MVGRLTPELDKRVVALGAARMADAMGKSFLVIALPLYIASESITGSTLGVSPSLLTGVILALFSVANSVVQPLAGRLSDLMGKRKIFVLAGLLLLTFVNLAFGWATQYWELLVLRTIQGVAAAFTIMASIALVNEGTSDDRRGGDMGLYNLFRLIGLAGGPLIAGFVLERGPFSVMNTTVSEFEMTFGIAAAFAFLGASIVLFLVEDPATTKPGPKELSFRIWDSEKREIQPIIILGIATLVMAACLALLAPIETVINEHLNQGPFLFSIEFAVMILVLSLLQPFVGRLTDSMGRRSFILIGLVGLVPFTLGQGMVETPSGMIIMRIFQGIFGALVFAPSLALAGDFASKGQSGLQLTVLTVSVGLGIALGQIASGFLIQFGYIVPFAAISALSLLAFLLVLTQVPDPDLGETILV